MIALDPLFRLLVRALSEQQPSRIHQPIAINELMDAVLPYRRVRREIGVDSVEEYETLLLRLCAGEGDFLQADPAAQAVLRAELRKPLPDLTLLRVYGDTHVVLRTDPLMAAMDVRPEERYAPPDEPRLEMEEPLPLEQDMDEEFEPDPKQTADPVEDTAWEADPVVELSTPAHDESTAGPPAATTDDGKAPVRCPFCGGLLPPRMAVNFCPHCGMGQDVGTCRACGADMDVGWRYCVSCGEEAQGGPL